MTSSQSKLLYLFNNMPVLDHFKGSNAGGFRLEDSEVLQWISRNTEALQYIFDTACAAGVIKYDPVSEKWSGTGIIIRPSGRIVDPAPVEKRGRRPIATVEEVVELLPEAPTRLADWSAISCSKFGFTKRNFFRIKSEALKRGLIESWGSSIQTICRRIPAQNTSAISATVHPITEPDSATVATPAKTEK